MFIGRTEVEAETPILWTPDVKSWLIWKDPDVVKDWRREKGMTENEMVGWHHRLNGHEFEQIPGDSEGQGSLVCCSLWSHRESDTTEQLNHHHLLCPWPQGLSLPHGASSFSLRPGMRWCTEQRFSSWPGVTKIECQQKWRIRLQTTEIWRFLITS